MAGLRNVRFYLRQRPVLLLLLSGLGVIFFLAVTGLSRAYHSQRFSLGDRWFRRGVADLSAKRFDAAVTDFRTALLYSRDNYAYQLNLAEALLGLKRTGEASAYLLNLWDREPEDGLVNLELARIAAQKGQTNEAVRHYHNAVYAVWPADQEERRRDARLELIELLLRSDAPAQARAELIGLAENAGDAPYQQEHMGDLFVRAGDYEHALAAYGLSLKQNPHDSAALAGAGHAAYELGKYSLAKHYLQEAAAATPDDHAIVERLKNTNMVLQSDPFRREVSLAERSKRVTEAFAAAGQRLKGCATPRSAGNTSTAQPGLNNQWISLQPRITQQNLQANPKLAETAMDLVFRIERETAVLCGTPTGRDLALLLISKLHEAN